MVLTEVPIRCEIGCGGPFLAVRRSDCSVQHLPFSTVVRIKNPSNSPNCWSLEKPAWARVGNPLSAGSNHGPCLWKHVANAAYTGGPVCARHESLSRAEPVENARVAATRRVAPVINAPQHQGEPMRRVDLEIERLFENERQRRPMTRAAQAKYYWAIQPYKDGFDQRISQAIADRDGLEIGCSSGGMMRKFAASAGSIYGIDISDVAVGNANPGFERNGIGNCAALVGDAQNLPFESARFDVVFGFGILHHLNFELALREIHRVLRPNGLAFFTEPMGTNPLINLYRRLTPAARTKDELPLSAGDLYLLHDLFAVEFLQFYGGVCLIYPAHSRTRNSWYEMMRKLSVMVSRQTFHSRGSLRVKKSSIASVN